MLKKVVERNFFLLFVDVSFQYINKLEREREREREREEYLSLYMQVIVSSFYALSKLL